MISDKLLQPLHKVKQTGEYRWLTCCPAHDDKSPSLAIREDNDRLLLHCFAGCSAYDVVSAVGLELSDLFAERPDGVNGRKPLTRPFPASDVIQALSSELSFISLCAGDLSRGEKLTNEDQEHLRAVTRRFKTASNIGAYQR